MKVSAILLVCSCLVAVIVAVPSSERNRRSVSQFEDMLECASGRSYGDFDDYGCFCGLGGFGDAVDSLDRCCQRHDSCYGALITRGFCPEGTDVYQTSYHYTKSNCVTKFSFLSKRGMSMVCESQFNNECQMRMCECDRRAAMCMAAMDYDSAYVDYDKNTKC